MHYYTQTDEEASDGLPPPPAAGRSRVPPPNTWLNTYVILFILTNCNNDCFRAQLPEPSVLQYRGLQWTFKLSQFVILFPGKSHLIGSVCSFEKEKDSHKF